jgi:hypothetical protein
VYLEDGEKIYFATFAMANIKMFWWVAMISPTCTSHRTRPHFTVPFNENSYLLMRTSASNKKRIPFTESIQVHFSEMIPHTKNVPHTESLILMMAEDTNFEWALKLLRCVRSLRCDTI